VEVLQSHQDVGSIELGSILLESPNLTQVEEKLATWAVLETEVQLAFSLERIVHLDDELVIYTLLFVVKLLGETIISDGKSEEFKWTCSPSIKFPCRRETKQASLAI